MRLGSYKANKMKTFDTVKTEKDILKEKIENMPDMKVRNEKLLDLMIKAQLRKAKANGKENAFNFYNGAYEEYFADYVRTLKDKKSITTNHAIKELNVNLVKSSVGNFVKGAGTWYNIENAYNIFKSVVASAEVDIAKKYNATSYYELEKSANDKARQDFAGFEEWKQDKQKEFAQLFELDKRVKDFEQEYANADENKRKLMLSSAAPLFMPIALTNVDKVIMDKLFFGTVASLLIGMFIGIGVLYVESVRDRYYYASATPIIAGAIAGPVLYGIYAYFNIDKMKPNIPNEIWDKIASAYGFGSRDEFLAYMEQNPIAYLNSEEMQTLVQVLGENVKEDYAISQGYESLADAMADIDAHSSLTVSTRDEALAELANERSVANELFAKSNGFTSYSDAIQYLENHKILVGNTENVGLGGAGWSEYDYDNTNAKIIAIKLSNLDKYYDAQVESIQSQTDFTKLSFDTPELQDLYTRLNAYENVKETMYSDLLNRSDEVLYTNGNLGLYAGNDVLDLYQEHGLGKPFDESDGYLDSLLGSETYTRSTTGARMEDILDNMDTDMGMFAGGGLVLGAGLTTIMKGQKPLRMWLKSKKYANSIDRFNKIEKQLEEDNKRQTFKALDEEIER